MTLEQLNAKRDEILANIFTGEKRMQAGDTSLELRDIIDLRRALTVVDNEIAKASGNSTGGVAIIYTTEGL